MKTTSMRSSLLLLLTAFIWGTAFVAQSVGLDYVGPFTFNAVRCIIGSIVLIPCIVLLDRFRLKSQDNTDIKDVDMSWHNPSLIKGGICCGLFLCIASNLQQIGLVYTSVGKAGFITALYVVCVPIIGLFFHKRSNWIIWICVCLSVAGLYLLCMTESLSLQKGDFLVLLCAITFALHIITVDHFVPYVDGIKLSCIQFAICGILSAVPMFISEHPHINTIIAAHTSILYAGVLSCGVAYTLQIIAQKGMNPTVASLIMCLESVVSALAGWVILGQSLTPRELTGCALMFTAIVLAQLPIPDLKTLMHSRS